MSVILAQWNLITGKDCGKTNGNNAQHNHNYISGADFFFFFFLWCYFVLFVNNDRLIASRSGHPFLRELITAMKLRNSEMSLASTPMEVIDRTGPGHLTRCFMNYAFSRSFRHHHDDANVLALPTGFFYPFPNNMRQLPLEDRCHYHRSETLAVHHWDCSWQTKQALGQLCNKSTMDSDTFSNDTSKTVLDRLLAVKLSTPHLRLAYTNEKTSVVSAELVGSSQAALLLHKISGFVSQS